MPNQNGQTWSVNDYYNTYNGQPGTATYDNPNGGNPYQVSEEYQLVKLKNGNYGVKATIICKQITSGYYPNADGSNVRTWKYQVWWPANAPKTVPVTIITGYNPQ